MIKLSWNNKELKESKKFKNGEEWEMKEMIIMLKKIGIKNFKIKYMKK